MLDADLVRSLAETWIASPILDTARSRLVRKYLDANSRFTKDFRFVGFCLGGWKRLGNFPDLFLKAERLEQGLCEGCQALAWILRDGLWTSALYGA